MQTPPPGWGPEASPEAKAATEEDVQKIVNSEAMEETERLSRLSTIARYGTDQVAVQAVKALEDLSRAKGSQIGPPIPLTQEGQIERLSRLLRALGRETSELAFRATFEEKVVPEPLQEVSASPEEASSELSQETSEINSGTSASDSPLD